MTVFTVGHSTRPFDEFVALLEAHKIVRLADVRTVPRSRRHPHFAKEALAAGLAAHGIVYRHFPGLGGLRRPRPDSPNIGWRNESFRGYADYMQTGAFATAVDELLPFAAAARTAVMCAEAVWWRCHRALLADALVVRGLTVEHLLSPVRAQRHQLCAFASVTGKKITYEGDDPVTSNAHGNRKRPPTV
jgi:uncharacterized protein (DUF488 family)